MTGARLVVMYGARRASMFLSFSCPFSSEVNVRKKKKERERTNGQISLHVNEKEPVKESAIKSFKYQTELKLQFFIL
jgi:hypothetical protein